MERPHSHLLGFSGSAKEGQPAKTIKGCRADHNSRRLGRAVLTGFNCGKKSTEIFALWLDPMSPSFAGRLERRVLQRTRMLIIYLVLLCWCASSVVDGIRFDVSSSGSKCVSEEIQTNVVVLANYSVVKDDTAKDAHPISLKVTSPYGDVLQHTDNVLSGQFGFTSRESGSYVACFSMANAPQGATSSVDLDWKVGLAAKDWATIARKDKIEGVELELRKLEGAVEAIHDNLLYLKSREAEMREVSETTNSRVAWFSIMSLMVCLLVSAWQLWYLKRYFEKKKLI